MQLRHRDYQPDDRESCIAIFRSNIPRFFREHELPEFTGFLDEGDCPYFVVLAGDAIVGCGGIGLRKGSDTADLCWGMVHREQHGNHIGAYLLFLRLNGILETMDVGHVRLGTSQHTEGFFRRYGFAVQTIKPDGIDAGLDDVEMRIELTAKNRAAIERNWRELTD